MFRLKLTLVQTENRWVFQMGVGFRILNAVTVAVLLAAAVVLQAGVLPVVLAGIAALGALYDESVIFDRTSRRIVFRMGILFLHRTKVIGWDQVAEVRVKSFGNDKFTGLELGLVDGAVKTIENDRGKASAERLALWGRDLAAWLEIPLVT